jgi:5-formyltetrahydrofolate cyclo-ligase
MTEMKTKSAARRHIKEVLAAISESELHAKSIAACALFASTPEFQAARVVMLYLSTPQEVDTAPLALKCWQAGKTVVVPKVSWDQRRMLPVEIHSLTNGISTPNAYNIREPLAGKPIPLDLIDLVVVPGVGFTPAGHRIGRGMGFYDRFLAQPEFSGVSCGLAFTEQMVQDVAVLDHDVPVSMLVTDSGIRRFACSMMH